MSLLPLVMTGASLLGGALSGGGSNTTTSPQLTDEQKKILSLLSEYGTSGTMNGKDSNFTGALGNYDKSAMEETAQNKLLGYATAADPALGSIYGTGTNELRKLISGNYYDPMNDGGAYKGYKQNIMKELGESQANLKRNAAVGGNLYSTNTVDRMGELNTDAMNNLTNKTAELYQNYNNQRVNGINNALTAGLNEGQFNQQNRQLGVNTANAALSAGGLDRALADSQAKDAYNNFIANRTSRLNALGTALGTKAVDNTVTTATTSPWTQLFNTGLSMGTGMMGQNYQNTGNLLKSGF